MSLPRAASILAMGFLGLPYPRAAAQVPSRIIYVDNGATSGAQTGTSWQDAYLTIWDAVQDLSNESGVEILVAQGTGPYVEPVSFRLDPNDSGQPGAPNVLRAKQGDRPFLDFANPNGTSAIDVSWFTVQGFALGANASIGFGTTTAIQGITFRDNRVMTPSFQVGLTISGCTSGCAFEGNVVHGGMVTLFAAGCVNPIIRGNEIYGAGSAGIDASGLTGSGAVIESNIVANTYASVGGVGISSGASDNVVRGNTVTRSLAGTSPYGISFCCATGGLIENNVSTGNAGAGIRVFNGTASLAYNDVWGNNPDYVGAVPGPGSLSLDPLFVDPDREDFRLQSTSPVIDQGNPVWGGSPAQDVGGDPRVLDHDFLGGPRSDMGADEVARAVLRCTGVALPGSNVSFDVTGVSGDLGFLFLGFNPSGAMLIQPFGVFLLGLSPFPVFLLAMGQLDGAGTWSVPFAIPASPSLFWLEFEAQGLVGPNPLAGQAQFTRAVRLRIGD